MIPQNCLTNNDCFRACIASLLELDANTVPNFMSMHEDADECRRLANAWLKEYFDKTLFITYRWAALENIYSSMEHLNPDAYYILGGNAPNGRGHTVICKGGQIAHDPSGVGFAPRSEENYFWLMVLVDL